MIAYMPCPTAARVWISKFSSMKNHKVHEYAARGASGGQVPGFKGRGACGSQNYALCEPEGSKKAVFGRNLAV